MFSFRRNSVQPHDLLASKLFNENTFYSAFIRDLRRAKKEVIIESPYMTTKRIAILLPTLQKLVNQGVKITIHTRFPPHHDELLRIQSWMATKLLKQTGVKVRFFHDYRHSKIAVIDGHILWEGSLNIMSQSRSREMMRRIESEQLTKQMISFLGLKRFHW